MAVGADGTAESWARPDGFLRRMLKSYTNTFKIGISRDLSLEWHLPCGILT
jgi:hypothetical protein